MTTVQLNLPISTFTDEQGQQEPTLNLLKKRLPKITVTKSETVAKKSCLFREEEALIESNSDSESEEGTDSFSCTPYKHLTCGAFRSGT
jgi:hypothetical protein